MRLPIHISNLYEETLTPENFLKLDEKSLPNISYSEIVPPKIGKRDFGGIKVHYKTPIYMGSK